jgi:hypothetical protein
MVRTVLQGIGILHVHEVGVFIIAGAHHSVLDEVLHAGLEMHAGPSAVIHHNQIYIAKQY